MFHKIPPANFPPPEPPIAQPYHSQQIIKLYSIDDLIKLKDKNVITDDEFKKLARGALGLDNEINESKEPPPPPKPPECRFMRF